MVGVGAQTQPAVLPCSLPDTIKNSSSEHTQLFHASGNTMFAANMCHSTCIVVRVVHQQYKIIMAALKDFSLRRENSKEKIFSNILCILCCISFLQFHTFTLGNWTCVQLAANLFSVSV